MDLKQEIRDYFFNKLGKDIETDIANVTAIAEKYHALQLLQPDVIKSVCDCGSQKDQESKYCTSCNRFNSI